jgi:eukaryotic-like serine/threonine-protein kinase
MTLHDRFMLLQRVGMGGMSEVWRADDRVLGRPVAVKVLASPLAADPLLRAATWREARAAARLTHPHVTQVYDYGEASLPGGAVVPYLVMELVEGESLADRLRSGPLPWPDATRMAAEVAAALASAHALGMVHRDVKPGNVMLTPAGAKVLDFGIAALAGGGPDTDGGRLVGTPAYAAPERLQASAAAPASDVYALGVVLFEALTGYPPVAARTWQEAHAAHRKGTPAPPLAIAGLPRRVTRLYLACVAADPADRPTAGELAEGLSAAVGQPVRSGSAPLGQEPGPGLGPGHYEPSPGHVIATAPLPHPATMIEPMSAVAGLPDQAGTRPLRPLLFGLGAAVVALGLALAVVTAALLSSPAARTAPPLPSSSPSATPQAALSASPSLTPSFGTAAAVVDQLDRIIGEALAAGRIDADSAQKLRDKLTDIRNNLARGRVRKQVQDLKRTIEGLLNDDKIDQSTADQLNALLDTLVGG